MAERLIKSLVYLVGFTGLGYGLLVTLSPQENELKKKLPAVIKSRDENLQKRQQFLDVLQAASNSKQPFSRLDKSKIEKEVRDN